MAQVDQAALREHLSAHLAMQPQGLLHARAPGGVGLSPEELCSYITSTAGTFFSFHTLGLL